MEYLKRKCWYENTYWANNNLTSSCSVNGFDIYPNNTYNLFVNIIDSLNIIDECKIIDLGCGNGLLLKHLINNCYTSVIPFGIDFLEKSIENAKNVIHRKFKKNFFNINIIDYDFSNNIYDIVILDPYLLSKNDFNIIFNGLLKYTKKAIIIYTYKDVIDALCINSVDEIHLIKDIGVSMHVINYQEVSFAVISKQND